MVFVETKNVSLFYQFAYFPNIQEPENQQNEEIENVPENLGQHEYQEMEYDNNYVQDEGENVHDQVDACDDYLEGESDDEEERGGVRLFITRTEYGRL